MALQLTQADIERYQKQLRFQHPNLGQSSDAIKRCLRTQLTRAVKVQIGSIGKEYNRDAIMPLSAVDNHGVAPCASGQSSSNASPRTSCVKRKHVEDHMTACSQPGALATTKDELEKTPKAKEELEKTPKACKSERKRRKGKNGRGRPRRTKALPATTQGPDPSHGANQITADDTPSSSCTHINVSSPCNTIEITNSLAVDSINSSHEQQATLENATDEVVVQDLPKPQTPEKPENINNIPVTTTTESAEVQAVVQEPSHAPQKTPETTNHETPKCAFTLTFDTSEFFGFSRVDDTPTSAKNNTSIDGPEGANHLNYNGTKNGRPEEINDDQNQFPVEINADQNRFPAEINDDQNQFPAEINDDLNRFPAEINDDQNRFPAEINDDQNRFPAEINADQHQFPADHEEEPTDLSWNRSEQPTAVTEERVRPYQANFPDFNDLLNDEAPETTAVETTNPRDVKLGTNQGSRSLETPVPAYALQKSVDAPSRMHIDTDDVLSLTASQSFDSDDDLGTTDNGTSLDVKETMVQGITQQHILGEENNASGSCSNKRPKPSKTSENVEVNQNFKNVDHSSSTQVAQRNCNENVLSTQSNCLRDICRGRPGHHFRGRNNYRNNRRNSRHEYNSHDHFQPQRQWERATQWRHNNQRFQSNGGCAGQHRNMTWQHPTNGGGPSQPSRLQPHIRNAMMEQANGPLVFSRPTGRNLPLQYGTGSGQGAYPIVSRAQNHNTGMVGLGISQPNNRHGPTGFNPSFSSGSCHDSTHHFQNQAHRNGGNPALSQSTAEPLQPTMGNVQRDVMSLLRTIIQPNVRNFQHASPLVVENPPSHHSDGVFAQSTTRHSLLQPNMENAEGAYVPQVPRASNEHIDSNVYRSSQLFRGNPQPHNTNGIFAQSSSTQSIDGNHPSYDTNGGYAQQSTTRTSLIQSNMENTQGGYVPQVSRASNEHIDSNVYRSSQLIRGNPPSLDTNGVFAQSNTGSSLLQPNVGNAQATNVTQAANLARISNQTYAGNVQGSTQSIDGNHPSYDTNGGYAQQPTTRTSLIQPNMENTLGGYVPGVSRAPNELNVSNVNRSSLLAGGNPTSHHTNGVFAQLSTGTLVVHANQGNRQVTNVAHNPNIARIYAGNIQSSIQSTGGNDSSYHSNGVFAQSITGTSLLQPNLGNAQGEHTSGASRAPNELNVFNVHRPSLLAGGNSPSHSTNEGFGESSTGTSLIQPNLADSQVPNVSMKSNRTHAVNVHSSAQSIDGNLPLQLTSLGTSHPSVGHGPIILNSGHQQFVLHLENQSQSNGEMVGIDRTIKIDTSPSTTVNRSLAITYRKPNDDPSTSSQQISTNPTSQQETSTDAANRLRQREAQRAERLRARTSPVHSDPFEGLAPIRVIDSSEEEEFRIDQDPSKSSTTANLPSTSHFNARAIPSDASQNYTDDGDGVGGLELSEPRYSTAAYETLGTQYIHNNSTHSGERNSSVVFSSMPEPPFASKTRRLAELFGITCARYLFQQCNKGSSCKYSHIFADESDVSAALEEQEEDELVSALRFIFGHQRLFHRFFKLFCDIYASRKNSKMLLALLQRCECYDNGARFVELLYKNLSKCYASRTKACEHILTYSRNRSAAFIGALVKMVVDASWTKFCSFLDECLRVHGFKFDLETCMAMVPALVVYYDDELLRFFCKCVTTLRSAEKTLLMSCPETQWIWPLCISMLVH